jgi:hypothetical protein
MKFEERMISRLNGLLEKGDRAIKTYTTERVAGEGWIDFTATTLDENLFAEWKTQSLSILVDSVGEDHVYSQSFRDFVGQAHASSVEKGLGILRAIREDIQNG